MWLIGLLVVIVVGCSTRPAPVYDRSANPYRRAADSSSRIDRPSYYTVRAGDTLYAIAWRYGLDFKTLATWNGIRSPYVIHPGQKLSMRADRQQSAQDNPRSAASSERRSDAVVIAPVKAPPVSTTRPAPTTTLPATKPTNRPASKPAVAQTRPASKPEPKPAASTEIRWEWPVDGKVLRPYSASIDTQRGLDLAVKLGEPVVAAAAGDVVYSGSGLMGYGELVIVKHSERYLSAYGNNSQRLVEEGDSVDAGQPLARAGAEKLHFEIRDEGKPVNPANHLPRR